MGNESRDSDRTASAAEKRITFSWRMVGIRKCARYPNCEDEDAEGAWRAVAPDGGEGRIGSERGEREMRYQPRDRPNLRQQQPVTGRPCDWPGARLLANQQPRWAESARTAAACL